MTPKSRQRSPERLRPVSPGAALFLNLRSQHYSDRQRPHLESGRPSALREVYRFRVGQRRMPNKELAGHQQDKSHVDEIMCRL
jgi:hypothetical protein